MTERSLTKAAAEFAANLKYEDIPADALHIGRRCVLDGLAVMIGGTEQPALEVLDKYITKVGGTGDSRLVGNAAKKVPAHLAAMWNGLAGHAMDWDDTQLAEGPGRPYGLLTHPTVPPLSSCLAIADMLGGVDGKRFMTAFQAGFEVECKIAEAINPDHYMRGFHTSGTIGTFGSAIAAGKLLGFNADQMAQAIGMARRRCRIVLAGLKGPRPSLGVFADDIIYKELRIIGTLSTNYDDFVRAVRVIDSGRYPLERMHTHAFPLERAEEAILTLAGRYPERNAIHVAIVP